MKSRSNLQPIVLGVLFVLLVLGCWRVGVGILSKSYSTEEFYRRRVEPVEVQSGKVEGVDVNSEVDLNTLSVATLSLRNCVGLLEKSPFAGKLEEGSYTVKEGEKFVTVVFNLGDDILTVQCYVRNGMPESFTLNRSFSEEESMYFKLLSNAYEEVNSDGTYTIRYE